MKKNHIRVSLVTAIFAVVLPCAQALAADQPMSSQQSKMATCNKDAEGKKGDERKAFMSTCLSAKKTMTQQDRMKMCNKDATGRKGEERKAFMSDCLKTKA